MCHHHQNNWKRLSCVDIYKNVWELSSYLEYWYVQAKSEIDFNSYKKQKTFWSKLKSRTNYSKQIHENKSGFLRSDIQLLFHSFLAQLSIFAFQVSSQVLAFNLKHFGDYFEFF